MRKEQYIKEAHVMGKTVYIYERIKDKIPVYKTHPFPPVHPFSERYKLIEVVKPKK